MLNRTQRTLRADERGAATLAPVYVIISVIIMATIVSALYTATVIASRNEAQNASASASRSAVSAMQAELNAKPVSTILAEFNSLGDTYQPGAAISSAKGRPTYNAIAETAGALLITFTVAAPNAFSTAQTYVVEFRPVQLAYKNGAWGIAGANDTPTRTHWQPFRTITPGGTT